MIFNDQEADMVKYGRYDSDEDPIDRENAVPITELTFIEEPVRGPDVRALYHIKKCGHLKPAKDEKTGREFLGCGLHGTPEQPLVCQKTVFPEGGYGCMKRRAAFYGFQEADSLREE
ncbi:hypothetical protein K2X83_02430 [Patescibacteria group bacterium]|nr:hypothetical protein [Patescibacteria group bacterium]